MECLAGFGEYTLLTAQSMVSDFVSDGLQVGGYDDWSLQAIYTGTVNGQFLLQVSNNNTDYDDVDGSQKNITVAGNKMWWSNQAGAIPYKWVRLKWTQVGGTTTGSLSFLLATRTGG